MNLTLKVWRQKNAATSGRFETYEAKDVLPDMSFLALPLTAPAGDGCVRIAVDTQGNPVAVVVRRATAAPPLTSSSTPVASLPNTSTSDDRRMPSRDTIVMVVLGGELAVPCTRNPLQRG